MILSKILLESSFVLFITKSEIRICMENHFPLHHTRRRFTLLQNLSLSNKFIIWRHSKRKYKRDSDLWSALCRSFSCNYFLIKAIEYLIHYLLDPLCEKYYITEQRYLEPDNRKKRCYTLVKWGYSIVYYLLSSLWAYKILIGTNFMPTWLGGNGSPYNLQ